MGMTNDSKSSQRGRAVMVGLGQLLLGTLLVIAGIGAWSGLPAHVGSTIVAGALTLAGVVLAFHGLFFKLTAGPANAPPMPAQPPPTRPPDWSVLFTAHRDELQSLPVPQRRAEILQTWRRAIDQAAHDYADLVLTVPNSQDRILQAEVDAMMGAYLQGYMAGRGWAEADAARLAAFVRGRALRDQLRALGLPIDQLRATLGTVMDNALREITELGLRDGASASPVIE